jgi:hypothetical protein
LARFLPDEAKELVTGTQNEPGAATMKRADRELGLALLLEGFESFHAVQNVRGTCRAALVWRIGV